MWELLYALQRYYKDLERPNFFTFFLKEIEKRRKIYFLRLKNSSWKDLKSLRRMNPMPWVVNALLIE